MSHPHHLVLAGALAATAALVLPTGSQAAVKPKPHVIKPLTVAQLEFTASGSATTTFKVS